MNLVLDLYLRQELGILININHIIIILFIYTYLFNCSVVYSNIHEAIVRRDVKTVEQMFTDDKSKINSLDARGNTALHIAIETKYFIFLHCK